MCLYSQLCMEPLPATAGLSQLAIISAELIQHLIVHNESSEFLKCLSRKLFYTCCMAERGWRCRAPRGLFTTSEMLDNFSTTTGELIPEVKNIFTGGLS